MKRILCGLSCIALLLLLNVPVMANEANVFPKNPVIIVEEPYAESESFSDYAKGVLQRGTCGIGIIGSKRVRLTATTFANQMCSLIRTEMYLFKYNPNEEMSDLVSGPHRFATANAAYGYASKDLEVPSTGYYLNVTIHRIGNEVTTTESPAVHVTY